MKYTQCLLVNGSNSTVSWIEASLAKVGNKIRVRSEGAIWDSWKVKEVWTTVEEDQISEWRKSDWRS
jgi:hypothetical protein